ncbi:hypothetical protein RKD37_000251 [Streptomyces ambofaciens]
MTMTHRAMTARHESTRGPVRGGAPCSSRPGHCSPEGRLATCHVLPVDSQTGHAQWPDDQLPAGHPTSPLQHHPAAASHTSAHHPQTAPQWHSLHRRSLDSAARACQPCAAPVPPAAQVLSHPTGHAAADSPPPAAQASSHSTRRAARHSAADSPPPAAQASSHPAGHDSRHPAAESPPPAAQASSHPTGHAARHAAADSPPPAAQASSHSTGRAADSPALACHPKTLTEVVYSQATPRNSSQPLERRSSNPPPQRTVAPPSSPEPNRHPFEPHSQHRRSRPHQQQGVRVTRSLEFPHATCIRLMQHVLLAETRDTPSTTLEPHLNSERNDLKWSECRGTEQGRGAGRRSAALAWLRVHGRVGWQRAGRERGPGGHRGPGLDVAVGRSVGASELAVRMADVRQGERADLVRLERFVREGRAAWHPSAHHGAAWGAGGAG